MVFWMCSFPTTLSKAKPLEATGHDGSRVFLPLLPSPLHPILLGRNKEEEDNLPNVHPLPQSGPYLSPISGWCCHWRHCKLAHRHIVSWRMCGQAGDLMSPGEDDVEACRYQCWYTLLACIAMCISIPIICTIEKHYLLSGSLHYRDE